MINLPTTPTAVDNIELAASPSTQNLPTTTASIETIDDGYDYLWSDVTDVWAVSTTIWDRLRFQTSPTFAELTNLTI